MPPRSASVFGLHFGTGMNETPWVFQDHSPQVPKPQLKGNHQGGPSNIWGRRPFSKMIFFIAAWRHRIKTRWETRLGVAQHPSVGSFGRLSSCTVMLNTRKRARVIRAHLYRRGACNSNTAACPGGSLEPFPYSHRSDSTDLLMESVGGQQTTSLNDRGAAQRGNRVQNGGPG